MQKFTIDSHSKENFICPFFRPPEAANPQKGVTHYISVTANPQKERSDVPTQATPSCEVWRESASGLLRNRWPNKKKTNKETYSKTNTSPFALTSKWRVTTVFRRQNSTFRKRFWEIGIRSSVARSILMRDRKFGANWYRNDQEILQSALFGRYALSTNIQMSNTARYSSRITFFAYPTCIWCIR